MIIEKNNIRVTLTKEEIKTLLGAEKILNEIYMAMNCDSQYNCYDENDFWEGYIILRELAADIADGNQTIII